MFEHLVYGDGMATKEEKLLARHADEARAHTAARDRLIVTMKGDGYTYRALAALAGFASANSVVKIVKKEQR